MARLRFALDNQPRRWRVIAAAVSITCGLITAGFAALGPIALASPCDGPRCVPNVQADASRGAPCAPRRHFPFGLDQNGSTLICLVNSHNPSQGSWSQAPPLSGVRGVGSSCSANEGVAQSFDGTPLLCNDSQWQEYTTDLPQA
jgi:hypothetical protein